MSPWKPEQPTEVLRTVRFAFLNRVDAPRALTWTELNMNYYQTDTRRDPAVRTLSRTLVDSVPWHIVVSREVRRKTKQKQVARNQSSSPQRAWPSLLLFCTTWGLCLSKSLRRK